MATAPPLAGPSLDTLIQPHDASRRHASRRLLPIRRYALNLRIMVCQAPAWLVITRLFFGLGWLRAAGEKIISPDWWSGATLHAFIVKNEGVTLPWFAPILDGVILPLASFVTVIVVVAQAAAGLCLIVNRFVIAALATGISLNLTFIAVGAVNPSAFYIIGQGAIVLWLLDRSPVTPKWVRRLHITTGIGITLIAINLPFITTFHPADVIEDPAIMMVLIGSMTVLAVAILRGYNSLEIPPPNERHWNASPAGRRSTTKMRKPNGVR